MTTIIKPQKIEQYFYVYTHTEKPNSRIVNFFAELRKKQLLSSIELIPYSQHPFQDSILYLYPNGITFWNNPSLQEQTLKSCLTLIEQNRGVKVTKICLCPSYLFNDEEKKNQLVLEGMTMGQYAMEIKRMERAEMLSIHNHLEWNERFVELKTEKNNSALDRYNIQKSLFEEFGNIVYQKKMERWLRILQRLSQI